MRNDDSRPGYLEANDAFYAEFWTGNYASRFPNAEEATRAGRIMEHLGSIAEQEDWPRHPPRLLDAGCGRGWLTHLLASYGDAEGCEPVATAVDLARRLFPDITVHAATPGQLRRSPAFVPFDVAVSSEVIEHMPNDLQQEFIRDLHDCLVPRGFAILTTPRREVWATEGSTSSQLMENWVSERQMEQLLREGGFTPIAMKRALPTGAGLAGQWRGRLRRWFGDGVHRASALGDAADSRSSLYQVWLARRS